MHVSGTSMHFSDDGSINISRTLGGSGAHDVEVEFPLAYAAAMNKYRNASSKSFHFVHCSGVMAERDQSKTLWFLQDGRREKVLSIQFSTAIN